MVVIGCKVLMRTEDFRAMHSALVKMAKTGVILLPSGFELLNEVPADEEVVVVRKGEGANDG